MKSSYRLLLCLFASLLSFDFVSAQTTLLWQNPAPIPYLTPLSPVQLNAVAVAGPVVPVSLADSFNTTGITSLGQPIVDGYDRAGSTFPAELLGTTLQWHGITFPLGPANQPDTVTSATVPLPAGSFASLMMLGGIVGGGDTTPTATFTVRYTDGTTSTLTQNLSDWVIPVNYPGESIVTCLPYRNWKYGAVQRDSVCVYGYSIPLDPNKTVASIVMPDTAHVMMLAMALVPSTVPGTIAYSPGPAAMLDPGTTTLHASFVPNTKAGSSVSATVPLSVSAPVQPIMTQLNWPTPQPITWPAPITSLQLDATAYVPAEPVIVPLTEFASAKIIETDGVPFNNSGVDGTGRAFSQNLLNQAFTAANSLFPLGGTAIPDAATSVTLPLPSFTVDTLFLLATAGSSAQTNQPFIVSYTDGTTATTQLSLSSWTAPQSFPGETLTITTQYADLSDGSQQAGQFNLYTYQITFDPKRIPASLTLPHNPQVIVAAVALGNASATITVPGTAVYSPVLGTILPEGIDPLTVSFTPTPSSLFAPSTATVQLSVQKRILTLTADNATRIYGLPNPTLTGSISGEVSGDTFTESFFVDTTPQSNAGIYSMTPSVTGRDIAQYLLKAFPGTLTITKAPVIASVNLPYTTAAQGQTITLTATIATTTSGTPTGQVQFLANGTVLGSANLNQCVATFATTLPAGNDTLAIAYSGDENFLANTAAAPSGITIQTYDFAFNSPQGTTLTAAWGSEASLPLGTKPLGFVYANDLKFTVSGTDPRLSSWNFTPGTLPCNAGPSNIAFQVNLIQLSQSTTPTSPTLLGALATCLLIPFALRRRGLRMPLLMLLGIVILSGISGCGAGYTAQTIPITVTASDGIHTHTLELSLQIVAPR